MTRPLLITAGATRNFIDTMRCITANASGKTGAYIASSFPQNCTLLGSPSAILHLKIHVLSNNNLNDTIQSQEFTSTMDLHNKMKSWVMRNPNGIIVHSAAVGDYAPKEQDGKITSGQQSLSMTLFPTIKILDQIKVWSPESLVVSFKAAAPNTSPKELTNIAQRQKIRSRSDLVFANVLTQTGQDVQLISKTSVTQFIDRQDGIEALISWIQKYRSPMRAQ